MSMTCAIGGAFVVVVVVVLVAAPLPRLKRAHVASLRLAALGARVVAALHFGRWAIPTTASFGLCTAAAAATLGFRATTTATFALVPDPRRGPFTTHDLTAAHAA
jgi:Na+/melibiose symporter-like transporter